jgi:uncharacterized membrane protein
VTIGTVIGDAAGAVVTNVTGLGIVDQVLKLLNSAGGQLILAGLLAHHGVTDDQLDKAIGLAPHETAPTAPNALAADQSR